MAATALATAASTLTTAMSSFASTWGFLLVLKTILPGVEIVSSQSCGAILCFDLTRGVSSRRLSFSSMSSVSAASQSQACHQGPGVAQGPDDELSQDGSQLVHRDRHERRSRGLQPGAQQVQCQMDRGFASQVQTQSCVSS